MSTARPIRLVSQLGRLPEAPRPRVEQLLRRMAEHVQAAVVDERFRRIADQVTSRGERHVAPIVRARRALAYWQRMRYVPDPLGVERIQEPLATVHLGSGDCNSLTAGLAAMLAAVSIRNWAVTTKAAAGEPEWCHVWLEVEIGDVVLAADPSPLGQGRGGVYLPLGRAPIDPVEPIRLELSEPGAQLHGFFSDIVDKVGDVLEHARDFVVNVATLKYFTKGLEYSWRHMGSDMRQLVATIGPLAANYFAPGSGTLAKAAFNMLETRRVTRAQKRAAAKDLEQAKASGQLPEFFNPGNQEHLEALWLAGGMPPAERAAWMQANGYPPERSKRPSWLLPAAGGVVALAVGLPLLPVAAVATVAAVVSSRNQVKASAPAVAVA